MTPAVVLLHQLDQIATDIGRLRRLTPEETSAWWAIDRISNAVETMDCVLQPSAAELYVEFFAVSGDHAVSLEEALRVADGRARRLREMLGVDVGGPVGVLRAVA
jgi:hypothetical protein